MTNPLWFGGFHYGVYTRDRLQGSKVRLFETLEAALKEAKFALHNEDSTMVIDLVHSSFTGQPIYQSVMKRKLKKLKVNNG